ncbi:hypothetical protein EDB19DRAFT_1833860 [Suillus lakei]|nr:hypothetical protein EDB19DRAFT_1833860 [Suillus lakei]
MATSRKVALKHRRPTKKENYREEKALRAAYEADPDGFEQELSELHSDIDREEETMFSDHNMLSKLSWSKPGVLTFSAGKIPPVSRDASATHKATTTDHTDDEDNNDIAQELLPIA